MDDKVEGMRQDAQVKGERGSATALKRSMTTDEENNQHPLPDDDDIPGMPPAPPEPPDGTTRRQNKPPSAELEGEWSVSVSCTVGHTSSHMDVPGVSKGDEDPRNRPKGVQNTQKEGVQSTHLKEVETTEAI